MPTWNQDDFQRAESISGATADGIEGHPSAVAQGYEWGNINNSLVAYYPMEQGQSNHLHDAARDNHGVINGATWTTGNIGSQALSFDGTDDYVGDTGLDLTTIGTPCSFSAWFYSNDVSNNQDIITNRDGGSSIDGFQFMINSSDVRFRFVSGNPNVFAGMTLNSGEWYHAAGTTGPNGTKLYVNGELQNESSTTGSFSSTLDTLIGAEAYEGINYFDGEISEVAIYDRALSPAEIRALYNLTAPMGASQTEDPRDGLVSEWKLDGDATDSVGSNDGTVNGATFTSAYDGQGASFDGTDDYIDTNSTPITGRRWTVSAWIYPEDDTEDTVVSTYHAYDSTPQGYQLQLFSGSFRTTYGDGSSSEVVDIGSSSLNEWQHVTNIVDDERGLIEVYVNGRRAGSDDSLSSINTDHGDLFIGAQNANVADLFTGDIDEVRVYSRALSGLEVEQLYHLGRQRIQRKEMIV